MLSHIQLIQLPLYSSYSVTREYKEFLTLYTFLSTTYTKEGVIIPPPPTTTSLKTVATVAALSPDEDLSSSSASEVGLKRPHPLKPFSLKVVF